MSRPLTLLESADLLGRYRYVELGLHRVIGERAPAAVAPEVATYLAGAARAHGFRARLVEERLPVSLGLPGTEALTRSPAVAIDEALAALGTDGTDDDLVATLAGLIYPAMTEAYDERLSSASAAADPPVVRLLHRLIGDLDVVRAGAEALAIIGRDGALFMHIDSLLTAAGGPFGPLRRAS